MKKNDEKNNVLIKKRVVTFCENMHVCLERAASSLCDVTILAEGHIFSAGC